MHSSKLYSILEHFNKYEQNRFRKYLQSPYFNKNEALIQLFELLIKDVNTEKKGNLEKEYLWKKIQKGKEYDDVRFRKFCSDLLKLVEGFLGQQVYEENPLHQATYLIEGVGKKKMEKLYNSTMRTARRLSEQQRYRPASYYFYQYQIEQNYYDLTQFETKRGDRTNFEEIANNLDSFYLAEKLRIYCAVISKQYFVSQEYKVLFIEDIIAHIVKYKDRYDYIPPISVYYQILLTLKENEKLDHYYKLKKLLDDHGLKFPQEEALSIYYSAINYCIRTVNKGNLKFLEELFILYNDLLDREIVFINDELSPWTFKNIIQCATRLGKYNWAESFIKNYNHKLPETYRDNAVTYNLAQVYFYMKKHEKVISLLQEVEYEDVSYNLGSKAMLLATYYETDEIEPLFSLFESFRAFLNRHKDIPANRRKNYANLIKFTRKLTRIMPGDASAIGKLREEIKETKNIASVNWLKEKITELEV